MAAEARRRLTRGAREMRAVMSRTVVDRIRDRAAGHPSRTAIVEGERRFTFAELFERVDRLSRALFDLGLRKGDPVLAYLPNVHEAVECELAALQSGLPWITLTARLTWAEVRGVVASCAPKLLVTDADGLGRIETGLVDLPLAPLPALVVTGAGQTSGALAFESLISGTRPDRPRVDVGDEDVARLRYTSGTTGSAKAAVLPHRVYHSSLDTLLDVLGPFGPDDRVLHVAPLTHGSGALLYPALFAGGENHLVPHFDAADVLSRIERDRITAMFTVPTMLSRLVTSTAFDRHDLGSLRALVYGGAPMPEAQLVLAVEKIGRALVHIYGMTEAPWPITALGSADHVVGNPRLRSVGRSTRATEVRIVDPEGRVLGSGEVGEIELRGRNVMQGYFRDEQGTRAAFHDGWLRTGDVGKKDDAGYVYIVGRQKDVIISGGFNVYASEVETALSSHPGVLEAAVVGLPHDDWGELVAAFVVPKPGAALTAAEVEARARKLLSGYKCPRRIEIVDDLPKNASGKIQKSEIVRKARNGWARGAG
jgi:acyl-CoA synthetase (AMP-forming)/AMP-acid ligase II